MDNTSFAPGNNSINNSVPLSTPEYSAPGPKHLPKLVTWVVLILALGFVGYAGIWYWQDQQVGEDYPVLFTPRPTDPTADWKTYTNTQYGIEIKYPPVNNDFNPVSNIGVDLLDDTPPEYGPGAFWIGVSQKIWHDRLENKSKYKVGDACSPLGEQETQCTVLSLNPYAMLIKVNWAEPINFQYSLLILTDKFEVTIGPLSRDVQNETFDQILSTFKFIDSADTSTWKTYTNTQYGFGIKYPSDWVPKGSWSENGGFFFVAFGVANTIDTKPLSTLRIYPNQTTLDKFIKYFDYLIGNWFDFNLNKVAGKAIESIGENSKPITIIVSVKNSYGYELASTVFGDYGGIVRTMGSTFKFIK